MGSTDGQPVQPARIAPRAMRPKHRHRGGDLEIERIPVRRTVDMRLPSSTGGLRQAIGLEAETGGPQARSRRSSGTEADEPSSDLPHWRVPFPRERIVTNP